MQTSDAEPMVACHNAELHDIIPTSTVIAAS